MPSVDRVNRYFPLTLAIAEPAQTSPLAALAGIVRPEDMIGPKP